MTLNYINVASIWWLLFLYTSASKVAEFYEFLLKNNSYFETQTSYDFCK